MGETLENSEAQARACSFLLSKQRADGGWGESYLSSQDKVRSSMWLVLVCKSKECPTLFFYWSSSGSLEIVF